MGTLARMKPLALLLLLALPLAACGAHVIDDTDQALTVQEGETDLPDGCTWNVSGYQDPCPSGLTHAFCDKPEWIPPECTPVPNKGSMLACCP